MFLTYVGESGSTGNGAADPAQSHQVYTGLFVHESQSISMAGEFSSRGTKAITGSFQAISITPTWP